MAVAEQVAGTGEIGILNVGAGDIKISFNTDDEQEKIRARRIVKDMLRRGYALLIEVEPGKYQRAKDFDESTGEYLIADFDPTVEEDEAETGDDEQAEEEAQPAKGSKKKRRKKTKTRRVKASSTSGVAVSRTAGG